ncbi:UNVERIFIED_CONTAM: hypothetical protein PYX00_000063 [Menopon gallinae]|uniref:Histone-lysine N-methyltransferase eggless n=1 Tax=Menopon gallinae TaxID=328185 RepID=A0AAW2I7U1_9NEOP
MADAEIKTVSEDNGDEGSSAMEEKTAAPANEDEKEKEQIEGQVLISGDVSDSGKQNSVQDEMCSEDKEGDEKVPNEETRVSKLDSSCNSCDITDLNNESKNVETDGKLKSSDSTRNDVKDEICNEEKINDLNVQINDNTSNDSKVVNPPQNNIENGEKNCGEVDINCNGGGSPENIPESYVKEDKVTKGVEDSLKIVDYQVQCVNLHCQSGYGLAEAPVFVLTYFGVTRRRNVLQKVCRDCFKIAVEHQQELVYRLKNHMTLLEAEFPRPKDDVVVMDPVEEIYEEEALPMNVLEQIKHLPELVSETLEKYDIEFQLSSAKDILTEKYKALEVTNKQINDDLSTIEKSLKETRALMYKDFTPKIKNLPPLNITEPNETLPAIKCFFDGSKAIKTVSLPTKTIPLPVQISSSDIVSVVEVEIPKTELPPIGSLTYPTLNIGDPVYIMKGTFFGMWVRGRISEIIPRNPDQTPTYRVRYDTSYRSGMSKVVTGKQMAYSKPSSVRYPVGTRVIALFRNSDGPAREAFYVGVVAEPPKHINKFRYLVFFDDGYAQYVSHDKVLLVCECSKFVHEDIHPESRDFIKQYLDQYPERPMVKLQKGQFVRTEWSGKWWIARVIEVDGSLAKIHFEPEDRTEWIYRGCTRLGPLYSELVAAAARKEQGALSRHRSLGIASLKKRNLPYVEYSFDIQDTPATAPTGGSKNVAKKSTSSRSSTENSSDRNQGPPKPHEMMEFTSKGYVRTIDLTSRIPGKKFVPHQCGPPCTDWTKFSEADCKGINPLALPILFGFERQTVKVKGKRNIMYRSPCGRRLRNMVEVHRYLRTTKTIMGLDLFDFDFSVHVLDEFHLESGMYCTLLKDISYGRENYQVSCVNEIDHSWPSFMNYSTVRIPQEGVNICLDEEFLVCCDCTDDCQDKEKCECWQLTIEGTKLGPGGIADPGVGYQYKRLLEPVTTGIYECNKRCKCASTCWNRVAQLPLQLNLQVFRTLKKGWGLRTLNDIPQGGFICIYAGRLHTEQGANDDGRMYGDEYLAELDYIEVVERFKEGFESDVIEPNERPEDDEEEADREAEEYERYCEERLMNKNKDDKDYVPQGLNKLPEPGNVAVNTRARRKKVSTEEKSESEGEKEKEDAEKEEDAAHPEDDDDEDDMKKKPSKFTANVPVEEGRRKDFRSVREMFGDGADDCYVMDAKSSGNIGRYLNHSCQPNVFVQNVFVDTHDVRFPWVAFFALTHIKAGTELTWDYNYDVGSVPDKVLYCYCNNAECRGRLI